MAIVVLTKVHQLLFDSLFDSTILHPTCSIYSLFFPADDTMPLFRTCSTSRHIYFARFVESISFLSAQQFCCIVCITFFWSLKHLGDYDLKVMRQEYYINRQKTVSSFSRYTYHADTFLYPFFLVFSYWFCPILGNIIKIGCSLYA